MKQREETNCPNCGAPIAAEKCPYCGTMIWDFSCIDAKEVNYIKVKTNGRIYIAKAYLTEQGIQLRHGFDDYYREIAGRYLEIQRTPDMDLTLRFSIIPDADGVMYREVRTDGK